MTRELITTITPDELRVMILESVWYAFREAGIVKSRLTKSHQSEFLKMIQIKDVLNDANLQQ
jgi:hypothetical protein